MQKAIRHVLVILGVIACGVSTAAAQTDTFMFVPGVQGGSTDDRHRDWIDLLSLSQAWTDAGKRGASCDVSAFKVLDTAGPKLWAAAVTHQTFSEIRIEVFRSGPDRVKVYEIRLTNARVSSITTGGSRFGTFAEDLTLASDGATLSFFPQKSDGSAGPPVTVTIPCS